MSSKSPQKKKGKSKRAHVLVAAVERATLNFVERGRQIARENPEIEQEMLAAVEEVQATGEAMSAAAREFATDPCSSVKRGNMVGADPVSIFCPWPPSLAFARSEFEEVDDWKSFGGEGCKGYEARLEIFHFGADFSTRKARVETFVASFC